MLYHIGTLIHNFWDTGRLTERELLFGHLTPSWFFKTERLNKNELNDGQSAIINDFEVKPVFVFKKYKGNNKGWSVVKTV